ncbi:putative MFS transporter [Aspergillus clavatus NRRL 1]|uniref:MFS transporter, putative n=1 Tax=Aspergillus clavatus (strain ATCC 1007 / CBS 513.65 / DSM 816 / NCTC 3887 / NRRL 1 / QM 1276 / 107) TaxID=344612 RepID=A1CMK7_ASPCL|nr:MFS transporter, putative [Aspergillus clavatus NRRL 1]EAW08794.1 MFS transporter, putative [Aspergillus clavatus NRRL 1]
MTGAATTALVEKNIADHPEGQETHTPEEQPREQDQQQQQQQEEEEEEESDEEENGPPKKKSWRFWAVFPALCVTTFLSALDTSILSTALPTIALDLHIGELYMWITNSGMAGGANDARLIIAGRTVQGIGGGGINTLVDIVICDLVPLRQRGKYVALMAAVWAVGTVVGPVLGGAFAQYVSWRWVFYINLPLCAASLVLLMLFLRVGHPHAPDTAYAWSSWQALVPLLLGLVGLGLFYLHQTSRFCREPSIPRRLFRSATATCALWIAFLQSVLLYWVGYFLPVYFQALRRASATKSGLYVLPITAAIAPLGIVTGILIAITGKYRAFHFLGFACLTAATGLFSLLDEHSPARDWAGFQVLFGAGSGMIFSSTLPPIQATLPESDVATATATWAFMRSFGCIWGIAIPTTIFNARVQALLGGVSDAALRARLADGGAYALASEDLVGQLGDAPRLMAEVLAVYRESLRWVWWIAIPFGGVGLLLCFPIKQLELSEELETEFGLQEGREGREGREGEANGEANKTENRST